MPVIKSAKKKLRQDKKATLARAKVEVTLKDAVKKAAATPNAKTLSYAASLLDKAAKRHIIHANKAARIKSRLAYLLKPKDTEKTQPAKKAGKAPKQPVKKAGKKIAAKKSK